MIMAGRDVQCMRETWNIEVKELLLLRRIYQKPKDIAETFLLESPGSNIIAHALNPAHTLRNKAPDLRS
jgi:hypothetical protein